MTVDGTPSASVVVRTKNSGETLERALASLRRQTVEPEIVVVDSGSTDDTLAIARRHTDRIVEIAPDRFTFGRALNLGAEAARAPIHFALSSHCVAERPDWIERSLAHYAREDVAGVAGQQRRPDGRPLTEAFVHDATPTSNPFWGYSNHASSWRAATWRRLAFREDLVASEDLEWSFRVRSAGWVVVLDPALVVRAEHRRGNGLRSLYRRIEKETLGVAEFAPVEPLTARAALTQLWSREHHFPGSRAHRQRVSPYRIAELAGRWSAGRRLR